MTNPNGLNVPQELDTMAALTQLVASVGAGKENLPATTVLIPDKDYSAPARTDGATVTDNDPLFTSPAPAPKETAGASVPSPIEMPLGLPVAAAPAVPPAGEYVRPAVDSVPVSAGPVGSGEPWGVEVITYKVGRFFFTGRTGVGKDWLAKQIKAQVLDSSAPLVAAARAVFPAANKPEHFAGLFPTIYAWGEGTIDPKNAPLTPARWLFVQAMQAQWPGYGTPGFWMRLLVEAANAIEGRIAITNVGTPGAFKALKDAGFTHFHVMTSPQAYIGRNKKQGIDDRLANALDNDAIKKVSAQRQGDKLPVIWNAPDGPPSPRLWTVAEFLASLDSAPSETFSAFE